MNGLNALLSSANTIFAFKNSWDMPNGLPDSSMRFLATASMVSASMELFNTMCTLVGVNIPYLKILHCSFQVMQIGLAQYNTPKEDKDREYSSRIFCGALCASRIFFEMQGSDSFNPRPVLPSNNAWYSLISFEIATRIYQSRKQLFTKATQTEISQEDFQQQDLLLLQGRFDEISKIPERYLTDHFKPTIPICPITRHYVRFPVIDPTCHKVFERDALYEWVSEHNTSPLSRKPLNSKDIKSCEKTVFWINFFFGCTQQLLQNQKQILERQSAVH